MIVDVLFVMATAILYPQEDIGVSVQAYQTLKECQRRRAVYLESLLDLQSRNPHIKFFVSECTPAPVAEVK